MIYGILLAAGTSSRMGRPKQLLDWGGQPLLRHVAQQALAGKLDGLLLVVGAYADAVNALIHAWAAERAPESRLQALSIVENPDYASGQASSLRAGLAALPATAEAAVVLLGDQPLVTPALINALIEAYRTHEHLHPDPPVAVIPRYQGRRGNPVLLGRALFAELQQLEGDEGARGVLQRYAAHVVWLDVDDAAAVTDVDTWEEYERLGKRLSEAGT